MRKWLRSEKGQQLVHVALMLPLLLGFVGLVLDVGNVYAHRRKAQGAADAAAMSGGMVHYLQGNSAAVASAYYYAAQNGYDNNGQSNVVTVTTPPNCLQVDIQENVTPVFASLVWNGTFTVRARARTCYSSQRIGSTMIVLDPTACNALAFDGNLSRMQVTYGHVHVNSSCSTALNLGNGNLRSQDPTSIRGGYIAGPNGMMLDLAGVPQAPITGQPLLPDPLAGLPEPNTAGMPVRSVPSSPVTLQPGIYPSGISITANRTVYLDPGIYVLRGNLAIGGGTRLVGDNVMIYMESGSIQLAGNGGFDLSAPDSGTYAGVSVFQARGNTTSGAMVGTSDSGLEGIVYMPSAQLSISGNATMAADFVVNLMRLNGNPTLPGQGFAAGLWTTYTSALVE
jgi:hypothetical protein